MFSCNFCKNFISPFFKEYLRMTTSDYWWCSIELLFLKLLQNSPQITNIRSHFCKLSGKQCPILLKRVPLLTLSWNFFGFFSIVITKSFLENCFLTKVTRLSRQCFVKWAWSISKFVCLLESLFSMNYFTRKWSQVQNVRKNAMTIDTSELTNNVLYSWNPSLFTIVQKKALWLFYRDLRPFMKYHSPLCFRSRNITKNTETHSSPIRDVIIEHLLMRLMRHSFEKYPIHVLDFT